MPCLTSSLNHSYFRHQWHPVVPLLVALTDVELCVMIDVQSVFLIKLQSCVASIAPGTEETLKKKVLKENLVFGKKTIFIVLWPQFPQTF